MDTKKEINYRLNVEPQMHEFLYEFAQDMSEQISKDDFIRALWTFTTRALEGEYEVTPQWLLTELERKRREAEALNTVEGEVGVDG